jgi:hypothetical protein
MNKSIISTLLALSAMLSLSSCVAAFGNRGNLRSDGNVGQQLIDLHKAKVAGIITDAEFQTQKAKLIE